MFGCNTFIHLPKEQKTKLDSKAIECIFLGYGDDKFSYILWDPKNIKLILSWDVEFKEDQTFGYFEKEKEVRQEYARGSFENRYELTDMNYLTLL